MFFVFISSGYAAEKAHITWKKSPGAEEYVLEVKNTAGKTVFSGRTKQSWLNVPLDPGRYSIRITGYNRFKKRHGMSSWRPLLVKEIPSPEIDKITPAALANEKMTSVKVAGRNFKKGTKIYITPVKRKRILSDKYEAENLKIDSSGNIVFDIDLSDASAGKYKITAEDTRGKSSVKEIDVIDIKPKVSAQLATSEKKPDRQPVEQKKPVETAKDKPAPDDKEIKKDPSQGLASLGGLYAAPGYNMNIPVITEWKDVYKSSFIGASVYAGYDFASFSVFKGVPVIRKMGMEYEFSFACYEGKQKHNRGETELTAFQNNAGLYFKHNFDLPVDFIFRLGGGFVFTNQKVKMPASESETLSFDFCYRYGISVRYTFLDYCFAECGVNMSNILYSDATFYSINPFVMLGLRL